MSNVLIQSVSGPVPIAAAACAVWHCWFVIIYSCCHAFSHRPNMAEFAAAFPNKISSDKSWTHGPRSSRKVPLSIGKSEACYLGLVFGGALGRFLQQHMAQFGWLDSMGNGCQTVRQAHVVNALHLGSLVARWVFLKITWDDSLMIVLMNMQH